MTRFLVHNIGWKLLSLAAAVLLWITLASEPELSAFISVRVAYKNLSPALEINSDVVETVLLEVRGPSQELRGSPETRYAVILDLSNLETGAHTFTVDRADMRLPRGIQLIRAIPAQVRLEFEPRLQRSVPVEVGFADGLPPDLRVVETTPEPSVLGIVGPASRVAQVASVQTDPLKLKPEVGTNYYHLEAYLNDPRVRFQDSTSVTVKVTVAKK